MIYHVSVQINGGWLRYNVSDPDELQADLNAYQSNGFPYSVAREGSE